MEQGQHHGSCGCLKPPRRTQEKPPSRRSTRSASAEKCPHGDDGWGEFVAPADPAANLRQGARQIGPPHPSHPIMRRPDADLEEKREPRVTGESRSPRRRRYEMIKARLDIGRDREAGAQRWPRERVVMPHTCRSHYPSASAHLEGSCHSVPAIDWPTFVTAISSAASSPRDSAEVRASGNCTPWPIGRSKTTRSFVYSTALADAFLRDPNALGVHAVED